MPRDKVMGAGDPFERDVIALFGLPFDRGGIEATADRVIRAAREGERLFLSTVNLDWLVQAERDAAFRASALASDHVTMDGVPVVKLAAIAGAQTPVKVAGSDLFDRLRAAPLGVFFFGGREGAARAACAALDAAGGPLRAAGWRDPGHGDVASMSTDADISAINASGADLLVVALGARKGQAWLMANRARLHVPVITHLGAVVDFTAGTIARAPRALQVGGFEWAWRIAQDRALLPRYAEDFGALPSLMRRAVAIRRLVAAHGRRAGPCAIRRAGDDLVIGGAVGAADLREPLRALCESEAPRIEIDEDAGLDLPALGQILLARTVCANLGRILTIKSEKSSMQQLLHMTIN